jgi:hypothetical protein
MCRSCTAHRTRGARPRPSDSIAARRGADRRQTSTGQKGRRANLSRTRRAPCISEPSPRLRMLTVLTCVQEMSTQRRSARCVRCVPARRSSDRTACTLHRVRSRATSRVCARRPPMSRCADVTICALDTDADTESGARRRRCTRRHPTDLNQCRRTRATEPISTPNTTTDTAFKRAYVLYQHHAVVERVGILLRNITILPVISS